MPPVITESSADAQGLISHPRLCWCLRAVLSLDHTGQSGLCCHLGRGDIEGTKLLLRSMSGSMMGATAAGFHEEVIRTML